LASNSKKCRICEFAGNRDKLEYCGGRIFDMRLLKMIGNSITRLIPLDRQEEKILGKIGHGESELKGLRVLG
jgi:hypothetical protein